MSSLPRRKRSRLLLVGCVMVVLAILTGWNRQLLLDAWSSTTLANRAMKVGGQKAAEKVFHRSLFERVPDKPDTIRLIDGDLQTVGMHVYTIGLTPPPDTLRLPGTLSLDPNRFIRVHSRFPGEVRSVGTVIGTNRPLRFGDKIVAGQLLLRIWSKEIGEKKSELVEALSKAHFDKIILDRLNSVKGGVVTERAITEAERNYQGDQVAVARAERTLRSWNLSEEEISSIHQEARDLLAGTASVADDGRWAEMDILAAQSGLIVEKNFNVGDIVDSSQDLFKIADLDRLQVLANVFEEDLPLLRRLSPEQQVWNLLVSSDESEPAITGTFDQISMILDPNMHTSVVMGSLDNSAHRFSIGQFVTAMIEIPGDPKQVVVPVSAVIEQGSTSAVFVETESQRHEFTRFRVAVTRRGRTWIHIVSEPDSSQIQQGLSPLRPGDRVLINSAIELDAELNDLTGSSTESGFGSISAGS